MAVQDASQLKLHYVREQADVILNIEGNIISGQVSGILQNSLGNGFGRYLRDRGSLSINPNDTSIIKSKQLKLAIPASKIAS